jgi:hypothetical protein
MIIAQLSSFGTNSESVWMFAAGVLVFLLVVGLILMGVSLIKTLINQ